MMCLKLFWIVFRPQLDPEVSYLAIQSLVSKQLQYSAHIDVLYCIECLFGTGVNCDNDLSAE